MTLYYIIHKHLKHVLVVKGLVEILYTYEERIDGAQEE